MKLFGTLLAATLLIATPHAHCRNTSDMLSIQGAMETRDFKQKLDPDFRLYFGNQKHPETNRKPGKFVKNKKNTLNKTVSYAYRWALPSAALITGATLKGDIVSLAE